MKYKCHFLFIFSLLLFLNSLSASSQQKQGANWFFGGHDPGNIPGAHLNFNVPQPFITPFQYAHNKGGGVATISDKNGQLLFFSVSAHVATRAIVNNKYQEMPNGNVFGNNLEGTFTELIAQNPSDEHLYYIFFIKDGSFQANHDLYVAQVDMRLNNGLGDVVSNSLQLLKKKVGPGLAAMLHSNNRDTWILTQNSAGDSLQARLISLNGIAAPVNSVTTAKLDTLSLIKSSPNSEMLVASGLQGIELLRFNRTNGSVSNQFSLTLPNPNLQKGHVYTFAPDNSKLYVGTRRSPLSPPEIWIYSIVQYDLAGNQTQIQQSANTIYLGGNDVGMIWDMQLSMDGKIYVARDDSIRHYLSCISCPNLYGPACNFNLKALYSPGRLLVSTLPALNQTIFRNAGILQAQAFQDTICLDDSVQLSAYGAGAERFRWQPANGLIAPSDTLANPFVKPTQTTTYTVTGSNQCATNTASVTVVVLPKPAVSVSGPASVCPQVQGVWYQANNPQKQRITWGVKGGSIATSSQDSISVNWGNASNTALVWALPRNIKGCPGDTVFFPVTINVILATEKPKGADTLCLALAQNISYKINTTTGSIYTWGIQGGSILTGQGTAKINVNWNQAGIGKLWVQEESQTSTSLCRGLSDTLKVLIHPSPTTALEITGPKQVFTFAEDQVYIIQSPEPNSTYNWQISGGEIISGQGTNQISVNWDKAGMGILEVTEANQHNCAGNKAALPVEISGVPQPGFYNVITPNNDQRNDAFVIQNLKWYAENELVIYNRWGAEVYRSRNYKNAWPARKVTSGVYYYYFRAKGQSWKGWVEVME